MSFELHDGDWIYKSDFDLVKNADIAVISNVKLNISVMLFTEKEKKTIFINGSKKKVSSNKLDHQKTFKIGVDKLKKHTLQLRKVKFIEVIE